MIDFQIVHRSTGTSPYFGDAMFQLAGESVYVSSDKDGFAKTRTHMYSAGRNPYVSFCDDDDLVTNLDVVKTYISETGAPAIYTNSVIINQHGLQSHNFYNPTHKWNKTEFFNGKFQIHQLTVVRRDIAIKASEAAYKKLLGANEDNIYDAIFFMEVAALTDWIYLPEVCYHWRLWNSKIQLHYTKPTKLIIDIQQQHKHLAESKLL